MRSGTLRVEGGAGGNNSEAEKENTKLVALNHSLRHLSST